MGALELWLGPAGCGKTGQALAVLRKALEQDWQAVRYLVPTVGHKRSIEQLLLEQSPRHGLFGDPVNIFFTFAQEVAQRGGVRGDRLTDLQKHLLLQDLIRATPLDYFARAARFPGFTQALGETIDELKVHMIFPEDLLKAAGVAEDRGAGAFAKKLHELGTLYNQYQQQLIAEHLYDSEGIMWLAAECLREQPALLTDLRCLILDGFARLTPIQTHFLRAIVPRAERVIVLFDYEEGRSVAYHPVQTSLDRLDELAERDGLAVIRREFSPRAGATTAVQWLRRELFRDRHHLGALDTSIALLAAATPAHEAEMIAREVRALLRAGRLPDGTPVTASDIAILARNADGVRERFAQTFARFGLAIRRDPPLLSHTPVGRALLAVFRLLRERWQREDVLTLLKSGFLAIEPALAFTIDLTARTHYLRDQQATWCERWPEQETRAALSTALRPLVDFAALMRQHGDGAGALEAVSDLLRQFQAQALPPLPPLPDVDAAGARRYAELLAAFTRIARVLDDLRKLSALLGHLSQERMLDIIGTALARERMLNPTGEGIPVCSVHTTGGEKFKVVFLCNLLQGAFPRHQRESAFLMDHEREASLRDLQILIDTRKHLEDDEHYWFLHALSSATHRLVLSYPRHDLDGSAYERSAFLDESEQVLPGLTASARASTFKEVAPPLAQAESRQEFFAGLAYGLRTEREAAPRNALAAAYAGCPAVHGAASTLTDLFGRARGCLPILTDPSVLTGIASRQRAFSASELQQYLDCPFLWFGRACLRAEPVSEEFSPLDRGTVIHAVLEQLYRSRQQYAGEPVFLGDADPEALWLEVEAHLRERLEQEPRFQNRASFLRAIEWDSLRRMMRRFLDHELERARTRRTHPAFFERRFGYGNARPLLLGDGSLAILGAIDRIDLADDDASSAVVVDYKSSDAMSQKDLEKGQVLQAPIYALALNRLYGLRPLGVEFMGVKQGASHGIYRQGIKELYGETRGISALDDAAWDDYLRRNEDRLCDAAASIREGRIVLEPHTKRCPDSCEYYPLCRGDRFALQRLQREGRTSETADEAATV